MTKELPTVYVKLRVMPSRSSVWLVHPGEENFHHLELHAEARRRAEKLAKALGLAVIETVDAPKSKRAVAT